MKTNPTHNFKAQTHALFPFLPSKISNNPMHATFLTPLPSHHDTILDVDQTSLTYEDRRTTSIH